MAQTAQKRRTVGETLEATPSSSKLSQLNILGSMTDAPNSSTSSSKTKAAGPKIIEISDDGTFEIPDQPDEAEEDEPPELDPSMDGPSLSNKAAAVQEQEAPSVMDEMMAAAEAARKITKDKAAAEEKRVKKEFGGGLKKGFFNSAPEKPKSKSKVYFSYNIQMHICNIYIFFHIMT
jgi:hypothetical protein